MIELRWQTYEAAKVRDSDGGISRVHKKQVLEYRSRSISPYGDWGDWGDWRPVENAEHVIPAWGWYKGEHGKLLNN